jgi:nucleotide-binding universal stress UspA family protein
MYRKILVPLDTSEFAEHALPMALALARRSRASIHLVVVSAPITAASLDGTYLPSPEVQEELNASYHTYLERTLARVRERIDVPITGAVRFGEVATTLCDLASAGHCDLVVMATHGRGAMGRFWLGSVADDLVHSTTLPLLFVRPGDETLDLTKEPDLGRVVVSLDGSDLAERILEPAVSLAALMPQTEIVLVRTILAMAADEESDVADSETCREAQQYLADVAARLEARGLHVRTHVIFDDHPADAILREVESEQAGLIALETHGRAGLSRLFHGSVADQVVRNSHVPVLVQRPDK